MNSGMVHSFIDGCLSSFKMGFPRKEITGETIEGGKKEGTLGVETGAEQ